MLKIWHMGLQRVWGFSACTDTKPLTTGEGNVISLMQAAQDLGAWDEMSRRWAQSKQISSQYCGIHWLPCKK